MKVRSLILTDYRQPPAQHSFNTRSTMFLDVSATIDYSVSGLKQIQFA